MNTTIRTGLSLIFLVAGSSGCSSIPLSADAASSPVERIVPNTLPAPPPAAPYVQAPSGLDDYKTQVARHVIEHNPGRNYDGILPPLLPAIVVVRITVDRDGRLADVAVQRSRNADASAVAVASLQRSTPLPRPQQLARSTGQVTFLETFLFADGERYQLRSLAAPQASE
jgi:protein TonB